MVELINKKKFAQMALDEKVTAFVIHVASLKLKMRIYSAHKAQIALLITEKVNVPAK